MSIFHPASILAGQSLCPGIRGIQPRFPTSRILAPRSVFSARVSPGVRVSCRSGRVWITCNGDPQDLILRAGESMQTTRRAKLVVEALEEAAIEIHAPAAIRHPAFRGESLGGVA